jgi:hypothetical protein
MALLVLPKILMGVFMEYLILTKILTVGGNFDSALGRGAVGPAGDGFGVGA